MDHVVLVDDDVYVRVEALLNGPLLGPVENQSHHSGSRLCSWGVSHGEFSDVLRYPGSSNAAKVRTSFYGGEVCCRILDLDNKIIG